MSKRLIYAEDAIEAVHNIYAIFGSEGEWVDRKDVFEAIEQLPSEQPEIIRCKDCKYGSPNGKYGCKCYHYRLYETHEMKQEDFCSRAERRTDERI